MSSLRDTLLDGWDAAARTWGRRADQIREWGMPVSAWLIDHLDLQPGERILELAAGPGDTGFLAAEMVQPGGVLVCSDGSRSMLDVARERAADLKLANVVFQQLQLEWIDLETASIDAILCRWGVMLVVDPAAALGEMRRVLKPGGRAALAVWDVPELNPWVTLPTQAMLELGMTAPPDPGTPGMFSLSGSGQLRELLEAAGFLEVETDTVMLVSRFDDLDDFIAEMSGMLRPLGEALGRADERSRAALRARLGDLLSPFTGPSGAITVPGQSIAVVAGA